MVELLIKNGQILTMDRIGRHYNRGAVAIDEGRIVAVDESDTLVKEYKAEAYG